MNCIIPSSNLKILGKAIHALAKIGDEIYFEANEEYILLQTVNTSTTVFGVIKLLPPFFTHYKINDADIENVSATTKDVICKIPIKAMLAVFRNPNQMERQLDVCKIEINNNPVKIIFTFRYKSGISKTHNIWLIDGNESIKVAQLDDDNLNKISATSYLYSQALSNFQLTDEEVTFDVTPEKLMLKNYCEDKMIKMNHIRSQLSLNPSEFTTYRINKSTTFTFALRSFRAAIQFAEAFSNLSITLNFIESGQPVEIGISNNLTFEATFILATMNYDENTQSTIPTNRRSGTFPMAQNKKENIFKNIISLNSESCDELNNDEEYTNNNGVETTLPQNLLLNNSFKAFKRCYEPTFNGFGSDDEIYADNSDSECEILLS